MRKLKKTEFVKKPVKTVPNRSLRLMEQKQRMEELTAQKMDPYQPRKPMGRPLIGKEPRLPMTITVPASFKSRLKALSLKMGKPISQLIDKALEGLFLEAQK